MPTLTLSEISISARYLHLPFEGNYADATGRNKTGLPSGMPTFTTDRSGSPNRALHLDGLDDFIECNNSGDFDCTTDFSVSLWFKADSVDKPQPMSLVSKNGMDGMDDCRAQFNLEILGNDSGRLHYFMGDNILGHGHAVSLFGGKMYSHVWTHAAITMSGDTARLYVNGILTDSALFLGTGRVMAFENVQVGRYSNNKASYPVQFFQGTVDEVRLYARSLSPVEVLALGKEEDVSAETGIQAQLARMDIRPNPFNPSTTVHYQLEKDIGASYTLYDAQGKLVRAFTISKGLRTGKLYWDGKNNQGVRVASGIYVGCLSLSNKKRVMHTMLLTK